MPSTARAKFTMLIPQHDATGNRLGDIAAAVQQELIYGPRQVLGTQVVPNTMAHWRDADPQPHDMVIAYAEDTPEFNSYFKQVAADVAQATNQSAIFCIREGKSGVHDMVVNNPHFIQGAPAHPSAMAQQAPLSQPVTPEPASPVAQTPL